MLELTERGEEVVESDEVSLLLQDDGVGRRGPPARASCPCVASDGGMPTSDGVGAGVFVEEEMLASDAYHLTYLSLGVFGMCVLLPFNALLNTLGYYTSLVGEQVDFHITAAYVPMIFLGYAAVHVLRCVRMEVLAGVTFALLALICAVNTLVLPSVTEPLVLMVAGSVGLIDGVVQTGLFEMAGQMPSRYTGAFATGLAVAGVAASLLNCLTKACYSDSPQGEYDSVLVYWVVATVLMAAGAGLAALFSRLPAVVYFRSRARAIQGARDTGATSDTSTGTNTKMASYLDMLQLVWVPALVLVLNFMETLAVFPGVLLVAGPPGDSWYPVLVILCFNVCDCTGRWVSLPPLKWAVGPCGLLAIVLSRLVLVALILALGLHRLPGEPRTIAFCLCVLLGLSNGFCASLSLQLAPALARPQSNQAREVASAIAVLAMFTGLLSGSLLSIPIGAIYEEAR